MVCMYRHTIVCQRGVHMCACACVGVCSRAWACEPSEGRLASDSSATFSLLRLSPFHYHTTFEQQSASFLRIPCFSLLLRLCLSLLSCSLSLDMMSFPSLSFRLCFISRFLVYFSFFFVSLSPPWVFSSLITRPPLCVSLFSSLLSLSALYPANLSSLVLITHSVIGQDSRSLSPLSLLFLSLIFLLLCFFISLIHSLPFLSFLSSVSSCL